MRHSASVFVYPASRKILILRRGRTDPWMPGHWDLPGGKVDAGETPLEAAKRETREEAGLHVLSLIPLFTQDSSGYRRHLFVAMMENTPHIKFFDTEHDDFTWVTPREAPRYPLIPGLQQAIERAFNLSPR